MKHFVFFLLLMMITCCRPETRIDEKSGKDVLYPVDLKKVQTGGEIGRRIEITITNNLLRLNIDEDFLKSFRNKTNVEYIGLGKLLDGIARMTAYTRNPRLDSLKNHIINEIIRLQEADGYFGNMTPENRMWKLWDIHEMGYIVYALTTDYRLNGNKSSLDAAKKLAGYIIKNWASMPSGWENKTTVATHVAITGIHRTMLNLYQTTGNKIYLDFCLNQLKIKDSGPEIVIGRRNLIEGHIYGYMALALARLELYRIDHDEHLTDQAMKAMHFLSSQNGMMISGGAGQEEIWTDDQDGRRDLGETCATAYQLRVYDNLLRLKGDPHFGDMMERTIYNALFGAQSPEGRRIRYFTPLEGGRVYHNGDTYCCPCNYRRIVSELPEFLYYSSGNGVTVNLYSSSSAEIGLNDGSSVKVRQETDYPNSGKVLITLDPGSERSFPLNLRIPSWCKNATVAINGQPSQISCQQGTFCVINRQWHKGDSILLEMPMEWRLVAGRQRQAGRVAVMRGPMLFCLDPRQNESLANLDAADLERIIVDRGSLDNEVLTNDKVRPNGLACRLKAGSVPFAMGNAGNLTITLTEFADPDGKCTYFRTPDMSQAVPDELYGLW